MTETKTVTKGKPAGELLKKKFFLLSPISDGETPIQNVTITEPTVAQQVKAEREAEQHGNIFVALLLQISELPDHAVKRLKLRDLNQIKSWLRDNKAQAIKKDGLSLPAPISIEADDEDPFAIEELVNPASTEPHVFTETERTFNLLVPISYKGRLIKELTIVEPDLEAASAAGRFKEETEQTSAMIAVMTGQIIPVIGRLALRDLYRLEVWSAPFVLNLVQELNG